LQDGASGHEPALVTRPESRLGNGHAGNRQDGPVTSPLPKRTIDYRLPAGISLDDKKTRRLAMLFAEGFTFRNFLADVFTVMFVVWFWLLISGRL
jgi:hypothetical protein